MKEYMVIDDGIHFTLQTVDSYNRAFNFIVSPRHVGKSKCLMEKIRWAFHNGWKCMLLRRHQNSLSDAYIHSIEWEWNKFYSEIDGTIKFSYRKGSMNKDGMGWVSINGKPTIFMVGVSCGIDNIKSQHENFAYMLMDEFINNPRYNERYLKNEYDKIKEIYDTFWRDNNKLKAYFFGNPYSVYNPYFSALRVTTKKLYEGSIITGKNYVVQCYQMNPILKEKLKENPLYQGELDDYAKFAFDGRIINDEEIATNRGGTPQGYSLKMFINIESNFLAIYRNTYKVDMKYKFYVKLVKRSELTKTAYCFDIDDLIQNTTLIDSIDRMIFSSFKDALRIRKVLFEDEICYYLIKDIYGRM